MADHGAFDKPTPNRVFRVWLGFELFSSYMGRLSSELSKLKGKCSLFDLPKALQVPKYTPEHPYIPLAENTPYSLIDRKTPF